MALSLRIGYLSTLYHTSHLLRAKGWAEQDLGIDCLWYLFGTGPEMVQAFEKGEIDVGYIGLPPAMIGISRGIPLICVAGGHIEGTVMVAGKAYQGFNELKNTASLLKQFAHRRIGIPAAGSIHDVIFRALLQEHSLSSEVEIVNYAWADLIPYAMKKAEIDGAVGTPPLAILCEQECEAAIIMPPAMLWPFNPSYGIVVHRDILPREDLIQNFLILHEKASNLIKDQPEEAARLTASALPGLTAPFVKRVYRLSPKYCASLPEQYLNATQAFIPVMSSLGYLKHFKGTEQIFDTRFIEKIHPEPHHY